MVMEYADAGTLAQMMQLEGVLSPFEALSVAIDVCKGLRAVHSKGIVHRDVKPANVMFFSRTDGLPVAKIGDFGIALQSKDERLTPSDSVVGTLIYLSPEQASSYHSITHASDLYSLGVILYEMLTGELQEPLFVNPLFSQDTSEVYRQLGSIPEPIRPLLVKTLRRKPGDRFQSADEMLQALERARSRLTASFTTQFFEPLAVAPLESQPTPGAKLPVRLLASIAVTLVLLIVGAMAAFGLSNSAAKPTATPTSPPAVAASSPGVTATLTPTSTFTPTPTASPAPTPTPSPTLSPTPSPAVRVGAPTRVRGPASLSLVLRDSFNAPQGVYVVNEEESASRPIVYLEGTYLWGEVVTRIGDTVFQFNRDDPDREDPRQHLPPYLELKIEYSPDLRAAMQNPVTDPPGFDSKTGEFWVGRFRCGSAVPSWRSPYWISVQLLEDGREIASGRYVIGVLTDPECIEGEEGGPPGPPSKR